MRKLRLAWRLIKRALYLVFGLLAFLFGLVIIGWIFYNLLLETPNPTFAVSLPKEPLLRFLRILFGFTMGFIWGTIGLFWMAKAGAVFRRLELWKSNM